MATPYRMVSKAVILLVAANVVTAACGSASLLKCTIGDVASIDPDAVRSLPNDSAWLRNARLCDLGEYVVVTPAASGNQSIFVLRKGRSPGTIFSATDSTTSLFDTERKRGLRGLLVQATPDVTALFNANGKGANLMLTHDAIDLMDSDGKRVLFRVTNQQSRNLVSYSAYDAERVAWIENVDFGPDGEVDLRNTNVAGRPQQSEFRIGSRWLERVERDGQPGVLFGGHFMSVAEARMKLEIRAGAPK